jgi:hypothetical protein
MVSKFTYRRGIMKVRPVDVTVGADPEGFFERDGVIIGSARVIPEAGLKPRGVNPSVVRDGVQFEFNPQARNSISLFGREVSTAFEILARHLKRAKGVSLNWDGLVEVSRDELDSLPEASRILGCQPSKNIYGEKPIKVDPKEYRKRSAGGHLHFGLLPRFKQDKEEIKNLIALLDIFVGQLSVLIDRDPGAAERRENYGRAGEYRDDKAYGCEYRTLSNFWLRSYTLLDFVHGMSNFAIGVLNSRLTGGPDLEEELLKVVNIRNVIRAIETNDFDLAMGNYEAIVPFLGEHLPETGFPLGPKTLVQFAEIAETVNKDGIGVYFPNDHVSSWLRTPQVPFSSFIKFI